MFEPGVLLPFTTGEAAGITREDQPRGRGELWMRRRTTGRLVRHLEGADPAILRDRPLLTTSLIDAAIKENCVTVEG